MKSDFAHIKKTQKGRVRKPYGGGNIANTILLAGIEEIQKEMLVNKINGFIIL